MTVTQLLGIVGTLLNLARERGVFVDGKLQKLTTAQWIAFAVEALTLLQKSGLTLEDLAEILKAAADLAPLFGFRVPE